MVTLSQIIVSLQILRDQLASKGYVEDQIEELNFRPESIRIRKGGKILTIPLFQGDAHVAVLGCRNSDTQG